MTMERPSGGAGRGTRRSRRASRMGATARGLVGACLVAAACARRPDVARPGAPGPTNGPNGTRGTRAPDLAAVYDQMGLVTARGDLPFVGTVAHFASARPDSTLVLLSLSLANRALTFEREGDRYRAPYEVRLEVRRDGATVQRLASDEIVRVATFRETGRTDESVLFYQTLTLAPGSYTLGIALRDAMSGRSTSKDVPLTVPALGAGTLSSAVVAYEATPRVRLDSAPRVTVRPRATVAFGVDTSVTLYVEGYGDATRPSLPVRLVARGERDVVVWSDTAALAPRGALFASVLRVPVSRLGIGVLSLDVVARDAAEAPNGRDSTRTALFVSLGEDLPVATFDDVLGYLRYFASPERLRALRETPVDARPAAWLAFLRSTDPSTATPEHEALRDYFARIRAANLRFEEGGTAGWLTDRGMAYIALGEPDQILDPAGQDANARGRAQVWEYRTANVELRFEDKTASGRWRLTSQSAAAVQNALRRTRVP